MYIEENEINVTLLQVGTKPTTYSHCACSALVAIASSRQLSWIFVFCTRLAFEVLGSIAHGYGG